MVAESVTFPIDLIKTRLQLHRHSPLSSSPSSSSSSSSSSSTSMSVVSRMRARTVLLSVIRNEGVSALFTGLAPALLRHLIYTPTRIVLYEQLRQAAATHNNSKHSSLSSYSESSSLSVTMGQRLLCGASSGALGQLIASPADLIKVRMQSDGRGPPHQRRYTGVVDAVSKIVRTEGGIAALWRGWQPNVQRAALVNLGELASYDLAKQSLLQHYPHYFRDNIVCHLCSSIISGFISTLVSTPADVIKTRVMNAANLSSSSSSSSSSSPSHREVIYRGSVDCLIKTVRHEGVLSLYKGFFPTWARLAPWQLTFWVTYEELRKLSSLTSF